MFNKPLTWKKETVKSELKDLLSALAEEYPLAPDAEGTMLNFIEVHENPGISWRQGTVDIYYRKLTEAARGIGWALSNPEDTAGEIRETQPFETFGVLIECSRNAVLKVDYAKSWLRRLALLGYNMAMLYTKDAYALPDEPFFGYLRGRYSLDEMREIDAYAARLGVELVGSIQALGHLEPVLRWPAYAHVKDTDSVLLTSEERSYQLLDKMLNFYSDALKSRRIHLGMDETHDLGRGRYMDLNGYRRGFDIYNDHLSRVMAKCRERDLKPMIWSDMYFRMGSKEQDYYDHSAVIPKDVSDKIPRDVQLVYWDYYHQEEDFYREWIVRHRELGFQPVMASGVWTWSNLFYGHKQTMATALPCLSACEKEGLSEFFLTMWGDDGMFCDFNSAFAGLTLIADRAYSGKLPADDNVAERFAKIIGGDYGAWMLAAEISQSKYNPVGLLWDDPLLGIYWKTINGREPGLGEEILAHYEHILQRLAEKSSDCTDDLEHINAVIEFLKRKVELKIKLEAAYATADREVLKHIKDVLVPDCISKLQIMITSFRKLWYSRYKTFGFEVLQNRFAAQQIRLQETADRVQELLDGKITAIAELDEKAVSPFLSVHYKQLATASYFV